MCKPKTSLKPTHKMSRTNLGTVATFLPFFALSFLILWPPSDRVTAYKPPYGPIRPPLIVKCRSPYHRRCFNLPFLCPSSCRTNCYVDCDACRPVCSCNFPGAVCQDPRFVGGDGNTFYFHGRKDEDFCLISDPNLHVNAHFIGKRKPFMRRDFTWVQAIGVLFDSHKMILAARRTATWDDTADRLSLSFDGNPISLPTMVGAKWELLNAVSSNITITRTANVNGIAVEVQNNFRITANVVPILEEESRVHGYNITSDDSFAHLELGFKLFNITEGVDGVLGQTYRRNYVSKTKVNARMPVMGCEHKYISSGLFTTDCAVSRFRGEKVAKTTRMVIKN